MYRFSRSMYRELAPRMAPESGNGQARQELLASCEAVLQRLACDRRHFARPTRTLFEDVRGHFTLAEQQRVYRIIERYVALAVGYLEQLPVGNMGLDGEPLRCEATTRKGKACQREPLPNRHYCPSHKHLEELEELEEQIDSHELPLAA